MLMLYCVYNLLNRGPTGSYGRIALLLSRNSLTAVNRVQHHPEY